MNSNKMVLKIFLIFKTSILSLKVSKIAGLQSKKQFLRTIFCESIQRNLFDSGIQFFRGVVLILFSSGPRGAVASGWSCVHPGGA